MSETQPTFPDQSQLIIIADADEANAGHLERQLRRAGVKNPVAVFQNGDELHTFFTNAALSPDPKPCVLFLEPKMPGANGYDPVRWIKREKCLSGMKVAVFSSDTEPEEIECAEELGVHTFLKKHPDLASLSTLVDYLNGVSPTEAAPAPSAPPIGFKDPAVA
jgi:CheY-like chemotaxis protein